MVVFFHFMVSKVHVFAIGLTGVSLFFMISGFVIYMTLEKITKSKQFIINRISRLYPTYWASVSFTFILLISYFFIYGPSASHPKPSALQYMANMTMFQYYLGANDMDGSYWTMIIEMIFYIGMLILFHFKKLKYLNLIGFFVCIFMVSSVLIFPDTVIKKIITYIPFLQFSSLFFAGTLFYKIYTENKNKLINYILIFTCLLSQIIINANFNPSHHLMHYNYSLMIIFYFIIFILFINNKMKIIAVRPLLFLGKISFALYLIHLCLSTVFIIPFATNKLHLNLWIASFFIALPITIFVAAFITYFIEIPMQKKMKAYFNKNQAQAE